MDLEKKLKEIEEHFANITPEEFEQNLIKAGLGRIKPASESGWMMMPVVIEGGKLKKKGE